MKQVRKLYTMLVRSVFMIKHNYTVYGGYVRFMRTIASGLFVVSLWSCNRVNNNVTNEGISFQSNEHNSNARKKKGSAEAVSSLEMEMDLADNVNILINELVNLMPKIYYTKLISPNYIRWGRVSLQCLALGLVVGCTEYFFTGDDDTSLSLRAKAASDMANLSNSMLFNMTANWRGNCRPNLTSLPEGASYTLGASYTYERPVGNKYTQKDAYDSINALSLTNMQKRNLNHTLNKVFRYVQQGHSPYLVTGGAVASSIALVLLIKGLYDKYILGPCVAGYEKNQAIYKKGPKDLLARIEIHLERLRNLRDEDRITEEVERKRKDLREDIRRALNWIPTLVKHPEKVQEELQKVWDSLEKVESYYQVESDYLKKWREKSEVLSDVNSDEPADPFIRVDAIV